MPTVQSALKRSLHESVVAFLNFGFVFAGSVITGELLVQGASSPPKANPQEAWVGGAEAEFGGTFCLLNYRCIFLIGAYENLASGPLGHQFDCEAIVSSPGLAPTVPRNGAKT